MKVSIPWKSRVETHLGLLRAEAYEATQRGRAGNCIQRFRRRRAILLLLVCSLYGECIVGLLLELGEASFECD